MEVVWLKVPEWENKDGLLHGFLGRRGGRSIGPYASLNLAFGVGDDPQIVKDNLCDMVMPQFQTVAVGKVGQRLADLSFVQ